MQKIQEKKDNTNKGDEQQYYSDQFQPADFNSYASKVQRLFSINYDTQSYEKIDLSATEMRNMMKNVSKILDEKIHKYYGLMGLKHQPIQTELTKLTEKLKKQIEANAKLIETQVTQIKDIEILDEEMASSKRIEKQAERLRQYFETKKSMVQAGKQARFSKGQINKTGQYLARDLDSQKYYFRLNKIKQDLQYAMLRDRGLIKKGQDLEVKHKEFEEKLSMMEKLYDEKISEAEDKKILIEDNKSFYKEYHLKRQLLSKRQELKKKIQVLQYNVQNAIMVISTDIKRTVKLSAETGKNIESLQDRIQAIQKQIFQQKSQSPINDKIQLSMSIKNIDVLLKSKRQKSDSIFEMTKNQSELSHSLQTKVKPVNQMTQSAILLKPNFKIKQYLSNSRKKMERKDMVNKSMDFGKGSSKSRIIKDLLDSSKKAGSFDKRILKWEPKSSKKGNTEINISLSHTSNQKGINPQTLEVNEA